MAAVEIALDEVQRAFVATVDGEPVGRLDYGMRGADVLDITHVEVDRERRGQGIAGRLTGTAFERARELGLQVIPSCPYAATWITRNDDYADLVDS
jgi:uncharacterized protein